MIAFVLLAVATVIEPLAGERWFGGTVNDGAAMPYSTTKAIDLARENRGGATSPFLVSTCGRYVWSDRPFSFSFKDGTLTVDSPSGRLEPVVAGTTLREAYLDACRRHFPFDGRIPAELLFTKPQWNNWIEIAIQGMKQTSVDAYTDALAKSGFPCGVYMMDGGWLRHQGSYTFNESFPDPKGMFAKIRANGWKSMIWTAHFVSPDSLDFKRLRHGPGYMIDGLDYLAYRKRPGVTTPTKTPGVIWWWSGISAVYDLTHAPAWDYYAKTLSDFAAEYGIDGFKFDAGDVNRLTDGVCFHDPKAEAVDYAHAYVRVGAERFPYNEYRCGFRTGGMPVMQRLHDQGHSWDALKAIDACVIAAGLLGSPYCVADMVGGGEARSYRPGGFFSEKLFVRMCAQQALHPMMQFSAAPWRYLSPAGVAACKGFAELHVAFGPYILELARQASRTGEPIVRSMEYEFPHQGFETEMVQFMLGSKWLVAPVVEEDDTLVVRLPAGRWRDDLGVEHVGPKTLNLKDVPLDRLPRFERLEATEASSRPPMKLGWEFCVTQGKTPKIETAKRLIDIAARLGYEQIQLFSKAAFRYEKHPEPAWDRSSYTWADVRELDAHCAAKGIELVPYQASFSHMEPWLGEPKYRPLAEAPEAGVKIRWGFETKHPMGLCPEDPRSLPFLEELWDELLPNFRSSYFNVGCDEFLEFDDGGRRSAEAVKARGGLVVYTDFLRKMNASVRRRGKTMMCWADLVVKHPETVSLIPEDVVLLDWGYEYDHDFAGECETLAKSGRRFWVCPGASGWNAMLGRVANMRENVANAWRNGREKGAEGLLLTTWGDGGHPQPWLVELPALVFAAACVREGREITDAELAARIDAICGCQCGETLIRWGNLYRLCDGGRARNASPIALMLRHRGRNAWRPEGVTDETLAAVFAERRAAETQLDLTGAPEWVKDDMRLLGLFLDAFEWRAKGDCDRIARELPGPYAELWLRQNRPGGLETSIELNLLAFETWAREKKWN